MYSVPNTLLWSPFLSLQKITRVKKIDEEEEEGGELTEEEIAGLSRGEWEGDSHLVVYIAAGVCLRREGHGGPPFTDRV